MKHHLLRLEVVYLSIVIHNVEFFCFIFYTKWCVLLFILCRS